jgi:hypothetical protein
MNALQLAYKRLVRQPEAGVWTGAIRLAVEASEQGPAHYLVAAWPPAQPMLPRWPAVAAIASPDADAALLMLMSRLPARERVWLTDQAADWALIAAIVRHGDRHLAPWLMQALDRFIAEQRDADLAFIRAEYSDRDEGFEAFRRRIEPG